MPRIQQRRYALINAQGIIWAGLMLDTKAALYSAYGSQSKAIRDGWTVKRVTVYFTQKT